MAINTLVSKVRAVTKSTVALGVTDDNVVDSLTAGCRFIMATAPRELLSPYADTGAVTSGTGFTFDNDTVIAVERDGSIAKLLPTDKYYSENISGASSLFARSKLFPGVYNLRGKLYVKPDPTALEIATFTYVKLPTILSGTVEVFGILEEAVIRYACGYDYSSLSGIFRDKMITELTAIKAYFTSFASALPSYSSVSGVLPSTPSTSLTMPILSYTAPVLTVDYTSMNAEIASDDPEIAASVSQKMQAEISEYGSRVQNESSRIQSEVGAFSATVQKFSADWSAYKSEVDATVSKMGVDTQASTSEFSSKLNKAMAYLQEAQAHIPLMDEYFKTSAMYLDESSKQFALAYKFLQTHVTKFAVPAQGGN